MLRAGFIAFCMMTVSRILGLVRESLQAATLGTSGVADATVVMLTLPDFLSGLLVFGALRNVLLPLWAADSTAKQQQFAQVCRNVLGVGLVCLLVIIVGRHQVAELLAPGLSPQTDNLAALGLVWSALAVPLAFLASAYATRLNHERDFVGMYGAIGIISIVVITALLLLSLHPSNLETAKISFLGAAFLLGALLRFLWLIHRLKPHQVPQPELEKSGASGLPTGAVWWLATAAAGLPLLVPIVARSFASFEGDGALAVFSYSWKLIETPSVLLIQVVATVSFPAIAAQLREGNTEALQEALKTSWILSCSVIAAIGSFPQQVARAFFGWGQMPVDAVRTVGELSAVGIWCLLPLSISTVVTIGLVSTHNFRRIIIAYSAGIIFLMLWGFYLNGTNLMAGLLIALSLITLILCDAARGWLADSIKWKEYLTVFALTGALVLCSRLLPDLGILPSFILAGLFASAVLATSIPPSFYSRLADAFTARR